jgi:hypothetical protein
MFVVGVALIASVGAHATASASYTFSCVVTQQSQPFTLTLDSFSFQMTAPNAGMGGEHRLNYATTIHFLSTKSYQDLQRFMTNNERLPSCKLTETVAGADFMHPGATNTYQWSFINVYITSLTAIGSDGSNTASDGWNSPMGFMQATFNFETFGFTAQP